MCALSLLLLLTIDQSSPVPVIRVEQCPSQVKSQESRVKSSQVKSRVKSSRITSLHFSSQYIKIIIMSNSDYQIDQLVNVEPRLWSGINRPGGVGRITKIGYCNQGFVETVDVKYIVGTGCDTKVDLDFIKPHSELERTSRSRRGRDLYTASPAKATTPAAEAAQQQSVQKKKKKRRKVSPSPGRALVAVKSSADKETITKAASTRMTLATGSELPTRSAATTVTTTIKRPVSYIYIPHNPPNVSPLPTPAMVIPEAARPSFVVKKRINNIDNKTEYSSKKNDPTKHLKNNAKRPAKVANSKKKDTLGSNDENKQCLATTLTIKRPAATKEIKKKKETNFDINNDENKQQPATLTISKRPATAEMKKKLLQSPHRQLPLASRRVPLRQVFDNHMDVRESFVKEVVGKQVEPTKTSSTPVVPIVDQG